MSTTTEYQTVATIDPQGKARTVRRALAPWLAVRVTYDNGDTLDTQIRAESIDDARRYYLNGIAQDYDLTERTRTAVAVDALDDVTPYCSRCGGYHAPSSCPDW